MFLRKVTPVKCFVIFSYMVQIQRDVKNNKNENKNKAITKATDKNDISVPTAVWLLSFVRLQDDSLLPTFNLTRSGADHLACDVRSMAIKPYINVLKSAKIKILYLAALGYFW